MANQESKEKIIQNRHESGDTLTAELFEELLRYREKKCNRIIQLHELFGKPVLTLRANYPGIQKGNATTEYVLGAVSKMFQEIFNHRIIYGKAYETPEGPTIFYVVKGDARTLKENAIYIEETHGLGRFVDIDVYDTNEEYPISRVELFHAQRKCFLCGRYAHVCARSRTHRREDLIAHMEEKVRDYQRTHPERMELKMEPLTEPGTQTKERAAHTEGEGGYQ